jgi:uncharacterized membrane protein YvlD (DUF360 family)
MLIEVLLFSIAFWLTSRLLQDIRIESVWAVPVAALVYMITDKALTQVYGFVLGLLPFVPAFLLEFFILPSTVWLSFKLTTTLVSGYKVQSGAAMFWGVVLVSVFRWLLGLVFM